MKSLSKNNTSGFRGVSFEPIAKKYRAYICFNKKKIRLGYFSTAEDAAFARRKAEILYKSNEFSIPNYAKQIFPELNKDEIDRLWVNAAYEYLFNQNKGSNESFFSFALTFIQNKTFSLDLTFNDVQSIRDTPDEEFLNWVNGQRTLRDISRDRGVSIQVLTTMFRNELRFLNS